MNPQEKENQEVDSEIKERLRAIFPSELVANALIKGVTSKVPDGASARNSNYPYYKEFYALLLKKEVDIMIEKKQNIWFPFALFCGINNCVMTPRTLHNRILQSKRFLIDKLDPDGIYKKWDELTRIKIDNQQGGIYISYFSEVNTPANELPKAQFIEADGVDTPLWKRKLYDWLESRDSRPFVREGLALTNQEILDLKIELRGLKGVQGFVTSSSIRVIKFNE